MRKMDISNGIGVGVSLFVQGCHFHCKNCFNSDTWDFNSGKEWTEETKKTFLELANNPRIKRVSILGGEPLAEENLKDVLDLVNEIRLSMPEKSIWIYSGYEWGEVWEPETERYVSFKNKLLRRDIVSQCNVMVDGRFVDELKDLSAKWKGSTNQRVIDVQESLKQNKVVLYCD